MLKTHRAITQSLKDANFGLDVAWPNVVYSAKTVNGEPQPFLELIISVSNKAPLTLGGDDGLDRVNGLFMINVRYATNRGAVVADDMVGKILDYYAVGRRFVYEGQAVRVVGVSTEPGAPDFGWYKVTVTVKYESYQGRK